MMSPNLNQPQQYTAVIFNRFNRPLHTAWRESQVWFSARDLGRLIGRHLESHALRKLDPDQSCTVTLSYHGEIQPVVMISESAAYMTLVHQFIPENRSLRRWLTHEVIAVMRDERADHDTHAPSLSLLRWANLSLSMLHWQSEPWIRLRDVPEILTHPHLAQSGPCPRPSRWRQFVGKLIGL